MSDGVALVLPEGDFRVHAHEFDVRTIVFTGAGRVEQLVVLFHQCNAPLGVLPDPVGESILDDLLFLLRQHRFPFVQDTLRLSVVILNGVVDAHILQIERFFQNFIGVCPGCAVGFAGHDVALSHCGFTLNAPFRSALRELHVNGVPHIIRNLECFRHKFLDNLRGKPCGTQTHINFRRFQVFRLCFKQCLCIDSEFRVRFSGKLCSTQLCAHIAGKVLIRHLPSCFRVGRVSIGIFENHAG